MIHLNDTEKKYLRLLSMGMKKEQIYNLLNFTEHALDLFIKNLLLKTKAHSELSLGIWSANNMDKFLNDDNDFVEKYLKQNLMCRPAPIR